MPPRTERVRASGVVTPARIFSSVDLPEPLGPTRPAWSPSNSPNVRPSKSDRVPKALLMASQLSRSGRGIRRYFFSFFGFFFSLRMPLPFAMGSPPLVESPLIIATASPRLKREGGRVPAFRGLRLGAGEAHSGDAERTVVFLEIDHGRSAHLLVAHLERHLVDLDAGDLAISANRGEAAERQGQLHVGLVGGRRQRVDAGPDLDRDRIRGDGFHLVPLLTAPGHQERLRRLDLWRRPRRLLRVGRERRDTNAESETHEDRSPSHPHGLPPGGRRSPPALRGCNESAAARRADVEPELAAISRFCRSPHRRSPTATWAKRHGRDTWLTATLSARRRPRSRTGSTPPRAPPPPRGARATPARSAASRTHSACGTGSRTVDRSGSADRRRAGDAPCGGRGPGSAPTRRAPACRDASATARARRRCRSPRPHRGT